MFTCIGGVHKIIREHGVAECSHREPSLPGRFLFKDVMMGRVVLEMKWCFKSPEWASVESTPYANWIQEAYGLPEWGPPSDSMN